MKLAKAKAMNLYNNKKLSFEELKSVLKTIKFENADSLNCLILKNHDFYNVNSDIIDFDSSELKFVETGELVEDVELKLMVLEAYEKLNYEGFTFRC